MPNVHRGILLKYSFFTRVCGASVVEVLIPLSACRISIFETIVDDTPTNPRDRCSRAALSRMFVRFLSLDICAVCLMRIMLYEHPGEYVHLMNLA